MSEQVGFTHMLGIETSVIDKNRIEGSMPITPEKLQPFGFLHGGATIAFLESLASLGAEMHADLETSRPFGIDVHIRHRKSGREGMLYGVAEIDRIEGNKQFWSVSATDEEGDVVSDGIIMTKVVTLARLEEKARAREAAGAGNPEPNA